MFWLDVERFKNSLYVGGRIRLYSGQGGNVGMEADERFDAWMDFTIIAKYPHVIHLEHVTHTKVWDHKHVFTPSYKRLYMMIRSQNDSEKISETNQGS